MTVDTEQLVPDLGPNGHYPGDALTVEKLLDALSNERRRHTLRTVAHLDDGDGVDRSDIVDVVAAIETDTPVGDIPAGDRKAVYSGVVQCHLPTLDQTCLVSSDDTGTKYSLTDEGSASVAILDDLCDRVEGSR